MVRNILTPGYLRWDGSKFVTDPAVEFDVPTVGSWVSYTPGFASSGLDGYIGDGAISGQWRQINDSVDLQILISVGSTTNFGSGNFMLNLPLPHSQMVIDTSKCLFAPFLDASYHVMASTSLLSGKVAVGGSMAGTVGSVTISSVNYDALHTPLTGTYASFGQSIVNPDIVMIFATIPIII